VKILLVRLNFAEKDFTHLWVTLEMFGASNNPTIMHI
jgi:hypothetical protein